MTRFQFRFAGSTLHFGSTTLLAIGALVCAAVLLALFVSTVRVSVTRGEMLREAQRAGVDAEARGLRTAVAVSGRTGL